MWRWAGGVGRSLMNALVTALAERGIPGVHLGVGAGNTGAAAFYRKVGFTVLEEAEWGFTMGRRVTNSNC
ncbi:hypothetical protein FACS189473_5360 [Spirochaetia bacterium]|nr:hypothetical protein FACS189473_5360 [Spirochaetia bacterium]